MTAALALAEGGFEAYLVEREEQLGGMLRKIHYTLEGHQVQEHLRQLVDQVRANPLVHVFTGAEVEEISGFVGNFVTKLRCNGQADEELKHGVVILATGAGEYRPKEYLYGEARGVVTGIELEEMLAQWSDGREVVSANSPARAAAIAGASDLRNVVMIQCVGSRNGEHPYCSRTCCTESVKNALKVKELNPQANVFVLYRDIRTYGFKEDFYRKAREAGVIFVRYDAGDEPLVTSHNVNGGEALQVRLRDPLLGEELLIDADLVALGVATVPREESKALAQMLKVPLNEDGFFLEAHVKLRPVDFATEGVFVCGLAHSPKFIEESITQAKAAASRASTILSKEMIEAGGVVPTVNVARCTACGLCELICAYNAVEVTVVDERRGIKAAQVNEALCKGCGACAAGCRSGAIDLRGFSNGQVLAAISAFAYERILVGVPSSGS
jgi:heterodisulfide reductase subunit A